MSVLIVDYGMGNLGSARRSFEECGATIRVSDDPKSIAQAERIVIPGVGAFSEAMQRIRDMGWYGSLRRAALEERVPVLGICLGMQLLADGGEEGGETEGLGLISGRVRRLDNIGGERLPHAGWNEVYPRKECALFKDVSPGTDFYFVHSYHFVPDNPENLAATTPYCGDFASAVSAGNVLGVQFHPEKSSRAGFQLIRNFLAI
jgi:imidazole glycerol-phosphate synthase subunit HisH